MWTNRLDLATTPEQARPRAESAPRSLRRALLNVTGQSRVTLSLRSERLRAARGPRQEGKGGLNAALHTTYVSPQASQGYHLNVGIVGAKFLLPTLAEAGRGDVALMVSQQR